MLIRGQAGDLRNQLLRERPAERLMAFGDDGKLFFALNAAVWPSGLVRNFASSAASFGCLLCLGTAR